jgi:hypothetical protein
MQALSLDLLGVNSGVRREIIEWCGFAIACWSFCAFAFAFFTFLHLGERAIQNHRWLQTKFGSDYPSDRKMVIPFVY